MARKKKNLEVSIEETKLNSEVVTDLEVKIGDKVIGEVHQDEEDRHFQVTNLNDKKGTALSVEDAVQSIISDYNLYN